MKKEAEGKKGLTAYLQASFPVRTAVAAGLSFAGACGFPWMLHLEGAWLGYSNSILSVFVFVVLFWLMGRVLQMDFDGKVYRWFWPGLVGTLFSLCMVFGTQLDLKGSVPFQKGSMWISIVVLAVIFTLLVRYFWEQLPRFMWAIRTKNFEKAGKRKGVEEEKAQKCENLTMQKRGWRSFLITAVVIFICYLPVFLAVYPGFFVYDAQDEYLQVVTRNFSTHHPLLHVLLLGGVIQLVYKLTDSYNLGIACYTLLQMMVMAGIFGWCVERLKQRGMKRFGRIMLTLYFGLCPVLVMFSLCSAKDGLFTGMLLIMVLLLQELCGSPESFFQKKHAVILFAAASLGMMLLRHNGFYAFLVFIPVLAFYLKRYTKKLLISMLGIVAAYLVINASLTSLLHADSSEHQEMLTVPISQLARVYSNEKDALPEEEKQILYQYLSRDALARYNPKVTDGVKIDFNNEAFSTEKAGFFKLWLRWGIKHPFTYLNAWFMTSYGYWYPDTVIDVYRGNTVFTYTYEDSSYFGYEVEQPGIRESKLPALDELYRRMSLEIFQQKLPVVSMLFSPGFLFWMMAFLLGFFCYQGKWNSVVPFVLPILCYLTVLLGPTYLVRYVVFLWVVVPLLLWELVRFDN